MLIIFKDDWLGGYEFSIFDLKIDVIHGRLFLGFALLGFGLLVVIHLQTLPNQVSLEQMLRKMKGEK